MHRLPWSSAPKQAVSGIMAAFLLLTVPVLPRPDTVERVVAKLNEDILTQNDFAQAASLSEGRKPSFAFAKLSDDTIAAVFDRTLLKQAGSMYKMKPPDAEIQTSVEGMVAQMRARYPSEQEFLKDLAAEGLTLQKLKADLVKRSEDDFKAYTAVTARFTVSDADVARFEKENETKQKELLSLRARRLGAAIHGEGSSAEADAIRRVRELVARINSEGLSFEDGIRKYSEVPGAAQDGGDLGNLSVEKLSPEVRAALKDVQPGQASAPVAAGGFVSVFYVESRKAAKSHYRERKFVEEREKLLKELREKCILQVFDRELYKRLPKSYAARAQYLGPDSPARRAAASSANAPAPPTPKPKPWSRLTNLFH